MEREIAYVDLEEIKKPRDGRVIVDRWWVHKPGKGVAFVKMSSARIGVYARDVRIAETLQKDYPEHDLVLIPVAFLGHDYA